MPTASVSVSASIAGISFSGTVSQTEESQIGHEVTVAAAQVGTLSVRSDGNTGSLTMSNGHTITTGMTVDLYWDGGSMRNVTVGTVSVNTVPIDSGTGDDLPSAQTSIIVCEQTVINSDFDGSTVVALVVVANKRAYVNFKKDDNTLIRSVYVPANGIWYWSSGDSDNPVNDDVGKITVSQADTSDSGVVKIGVLYSGV